MAEFDKDILEIEGGYTNDPDDAGGETKYGISKRSYPNEDIKNLTFERAVFIYKRDFWNPHRLSEIQDQTTANIIFLFIINAGASRGVRMVQECVNSFAPIVEQLKVDGIIGAKTIRAISMIRPLRFQDCFRVAVCKYYLALVLRKPSQEKYFKGWIRRALM